MKNKIKIPKPNHNPEQIQISSMKLHFPQFKYHYNEEKNLTFEGELQPSPSMPVYRVTIEFRGNSMPRVKVISPALVEKPPHYYHSLSCLCLYKPDDFKWTSTKPMSNYILPWTCCWLYFYEVWKQKNEWLGPEASHEINTEKYE